jgi:hypothetical protein
MSYLDIQAGAEYLEDEMDQKLLDLDDEIDPETLEDETQAQQLAVRSSYRVAVMSMADER